MRNDWNDLYESTQRPAASMANTSSTGRKLNRAPQRLAAEQSQSVSAQSTSAQAQTQCAPTAAQRRQAMKQAQRAQAERERQAIAAEKQAKKQTAQAVAAHMAQKKAAQENATQSGATVSHNAAKRKAAKRKAEAQAAKRKQTAQASATRTKRNPQEDMRKSKNQAQASRKQNLNANLKKKRNLNANPNPNHAPLYNQYDGAPVGQDATPRAQKHTKGGKQASPLTKAAIRRRKRIASFVASLLVLAIVVVGVIYSVNLIFKVKTIEIQTVSGEVPADTGIYTEASILAQLNISIEDNFFSFRTKEQESALQSAFPLLENIQVMRDYPNTILVRLEPAVETYTMQIASGWIILSDRLHVMSTSVTKPNLLWLIGEAPSSYAAGQALSFVKTLEPSWYEAHAEADNLQELAAQEAQLRSDTQIVTMQSLLNALEEAELLADITAIEFNGEDGISFLYQDRIAVLIGTNNSLSYKLELVEYILSNKNGDGCASTDTGLLDVSYQSADGTITTTFAQGAVQFPLNSVPSEPTPEEGTAEEVVPEEGDSAAASSQTSEE